MQHRLFRIGFIISLMVLTFAAIPILSQEDAIDLTNLPLGDGNITFDVPVVGSVFSCVTEFNGGGAHLDGPWIRDDGTWDMTAKTANVDGAIDWPSEFEVSLEGNTRVIIGNGLPSHPTGVYPVSSNDDAYTYDRNPNTISVQDVRYELPANPQLAASPSCVGFGPVAIMLSGGVYFMALDTLGRDPAAHEILDNCHGHPESSGEYHYHDLSTCVEPEAPDDGHSDLFGYALDGFGIFGRYGEEGETMTNADLDECHGHTHEIDWDGETVEMFHYHATWEYPYIVSCYRGTPIAAATVGGGGQGGGQAPAGGGGQGGQPPPTRTGGGQGGQPPPPTPGG